MKLDFLELIFMRRPWIGLSLVWVLSGEVMVRAYCAIFVLLRVINFDYLFSPGEPFSL